MQLEKISEEEAREIFRSKSAAGRLQNLLDEFMHMDATIVRIKVKPNEYTNIACAANSIRTAIRRSKYAIKLHRVRNELFLIKTALVKDI